VTSRTPSLDDGATPSLRYWRSLAELPVDRAVGLAGLETCFREGGPVGSLEGEKRGRLHTTTIGYGLDPVFGGLARLWMPWKGKTFDAERKEGSNLFASSWRVPRRLIWPGYDVERPAGPGRISTFRFSTWSGESAVIPGLEVLKIDYDLPESPRFMIRTILDEVVRIDDGLYLGQALMRWRGAFGRAAWFSLQDL
jgi:hypothetical protein